VFVWLVWRGLVIPGEDGANYRQNRGVLAAVPLGGIGLEFDRVTQVFLKGEIVGIEVDNPFVHPGAVKIVVDVEARAGVCDSCAIRLHPLVVSLHNPPVCVDTFDRTAASLRPITAPLTAVTRQLAPFGETARQSA
jgi:hypothetical protein